MFFTVDSSDSNSFDITRKPLGIHNMPPFSPVSKASVVKKGLPTPIRKKIESLRRVPGESPNRSKNASTPKKINVIEEKKEPRKALPTPLRQGIQLRLQNEPSSQPALIGLVDRMKTPSKKDSNQERKILPTPLRLGIHNRRNSPDASEPLVIKSAMKKQRDSAELPQPPKRVNFNLQEAIVARKKTLRHVGVAANVIQQIEEEQVLASKTSVKSLVPTPLRKAVEMRRAKIDAMEAEIETQSLTQNDAQPSNQIPIVEEPSFPLDNVKRQLFTPLKNEISKRRKSTRINLEPTALNDDEKRVEEVETDSKFLSPVIEKVVIAIHEALRSPAQEKSAVTPVIALATPLRTAIQARRQSYSSTKPEVILESVPATKEAESFKEELMPNIEPEVENSETHFEMEVEVETKDNEEKALTLATESLVKDVITSHSLQLTAEVLCADETEEVEDLRSYHTIAETVAQLLVTSLPQTLGTPSKRKISLPGNASGLFSPITPSNDRQQKYVLNSLEKKSRAFYSQRFTDTATEREIFLADLVGSLSDVDIEIIEGYAEKLTKIASTVLDECDAFGVAMDAYIRGIEIALNNTESKNGAQMKEVIPQDDVCIFQVDEKSHKGEDDDEEEVDTEDESEEDDLASKKDYCTDYSDVLCRLFRLPRDFLDANSDVMDEELVESYAEELTLSAGVCSAVAYGIALDSFLTDPVQFRHYVGRLALPVYHQTQRIPSSRDAVEEMEHVAEFIASTRTEAEQMPKAALITKTPTRKNRKDVDLPCSSRTLRSAKKQEGFKEDLDSARIAKTPERAVVTLSRNGKEELLDTNIENDKGSNHNSTTSTNASEVIEVSIHLIEEAKEMNMSDQTFLPTRSDIMEGELVPENTQEPRKDAEEHPQLMNDEKVGEVTPENDESQGKDLLENLVIGKKRKSSPANVQEETKVDEIPESTKRRKGEVSNVAAPLHVQRSEAQSKKRGREIANEEVREKEEAETKEEMKEDKSSIKKRKNDDEVLEIPLTFDGIVVKKRGRGKKTIDEVLSKTEEEKEPTPIIPISTLRATRNNKLKEETVVKSSQASKGKGKSRGKSKQEAEEEEDMEEALAILCDG